MLLSVGPSNRHGPKSMLIWLPRRMLNTWTNEKERQRSRVTLLQCAEKKSSVLSEATDDASTRHCTHFLPHSTLQVHSDSDPDERRIHDLCRRHVEELAKIAFFHSGRKATERLLWSTTCERPGCVPEMAMAGLRMASLESAGSFCGDAQMQGFARQLGGFSDRSHELFYALHVRCGKKKRNLAGRLAKVQELVDVQRHLVLLSQKASTKLGVCEVVGDLEPETSILIGISDLNGSQFVLDRMMKNLEDLRPEIECLNVKAMKKKKNDGSSSASSSESSDSDMGKPMDMPALRKRKNSPAVAVAAQTSAPENRTHSIPPVHAEPLSQTHTDMVILPLFHSAERKPPQVEEPAIVAACCTANSASPVTAQEIYRRGPIEPKDTLSGRVIVDATPSSPPSPGISVFMEANTRAVIEVCTIGKCKRGGSQQILASLQARVPAPDVSVTSCKCMGKCKSAPNVRVKNDEGRTQVHSYVSVDDVDTLVALHLGGPLLARVDYGVAAA